MMQAALPEQYSKLLNIQTECIQTLGDAYTQKEIDTWIGYLERATPERFASFKNSAWTDDRGNIEGFVSWREDDTSNTVALECLYVREHLRNQGIGRLLLEKAEADIAVGSRIVVRSTLNARSFYEKYGYTFKERGISRAGFAIVVLEKVIGA